MSSHSDVRLSISTKLSIRPYMIEEVRAIIAPPNFLDPIYSLLGLADRVIEILAENAPTELNCLQFCHLSR